MRGNTTENDPTSKLLRRRINPKGTSPNLLSFKATNRTPHKASDIELMKIEVFNSTAPLIEKLLQNRKSQTWQLEEPADRELLKTILQENRFLFPTVSKDLKKLLPLSDQNIDANPTLALREISLEIARKIAHDIIAYSEAEKLQYGEASRQLIQRLQEGGRVAKEAEIIVQAYLPLEIKE